LVSVSSSCLMMVHAISVVVQEFFMMVHVFSSGFSSFIDGSCRPHDGPCFLVIFHAGPS
jgi:hypothetical protein